MPPLISVAEAAALINAKPWDVMRLIDAGLIRYAVLVDPDSLTDYQEQHA